MPKYVPVVPCWVKEGAIIFGWKAAAARGAAGAETFRSVCQEYRSQMQADSIL